MENINGNQAEVEKLAQANAEIFEAAYVPVFFDKLAKDHGIVPSTEAEAIEILKIAADMAQAGYNPQEAEAAEAISPIKEARAALSSCLPLHEQAADNMVAQFQADPEIRKIAKKSLGLVD